MLAVRLQLLALSIAAGAPVAAQDPAADAPDEVQLLRQIDEGELRDRRAAIVAARALETPALVTKLTEIARSDEHVALRQEAIRTLGYYRGEDGLAVLRALLRELKEGERQPRLIAAAYEALGRRRDPQVFDVLAAALGARQVETAGAALGLELLADPRGYDPLARALRPFELALIDGMPIFRAMFACDRERATAFFCASMLDASTPQPYRFRFEEVLRQNPGADVAVAAHSLVGAEYPDAVERGLRILGTCKRVEDVPVITKVLHAQPRYRLACIQALGAMAHELTVDDLLRYLPDEDPKIRAEVAYALGEVGADRVTPDLVAQLLGEDDVRARIRIVEALGRIGDRRAVASLIPLLRDREFERDSPLSSMRNPFPGNTEVRYVALWALQRIRDGEAKYDFRLRNPGQWADVAPAREFDAWHDWWKEHEGDESLRVDRG